MPATTITRTTWTDDDGTGTTGTIIKNSELQLIYDKIDALLAGALTFGGAVTTTGNLTVNGTVASSVSVNSLRQHIFDNIGAGNATAVEFNFTDQVSGSAVLRYNASTFTPSGLQLAQGATISGTGSGGLLVSAPHASGTIRFVTGTTLRGTVTASGDLDWVGQITWNAGANTLNSTGVYMTTWPTTASPANANVANAEYIRLVTSRRAAKYAIQPITVRDAHRTIMGLRGVTYRSRVDRDRRRWAGFIADDAEQINPTLTTYDERGELQSFTYDRVAAYLVPVVQNLEARLRALEAT